ncbi:IS3 family transposase [Polymorphospora rubra]|uniref:IS3 family transposase n=1 Tax=Polymorphospora rubra TaxID=338584 RepID=UPI0033EC82B0
MNELKDRFGVEPVLRVLRIAPSTYYGWLARQAAPGPREVEDRGLLSEIVDIHDRSAHTYGSPRVHATLARRGIRVGRKRVERLMREHDLQGAFLRRGWRAGSTKQNPKADPAPDLVNRDFTADAPNRLWVADATRIVTGEGVLWLAAVRDAFSNRIVGWKTSDRCNTDLVLGALEYGIWSRDVRDGQLIHHSDRGSTGEFNRSSQHLEFGGVDGSAGGVDEGVDGQVADEVAGQAVASAGCRASVLARDRPRAQ